MFTGLPPVPMRHRSAPLGAMELAEAATSAGSDAGLKRALRDARLAEAAHFEAALDLRDAKSIRLQLLKDDVAAAAASPEAGDLFDLALVPGDPPKLWVDLITFVVMEPDPRTYRLVQGRHNGREILFESGDRVQAAEQVRHHMAHRIVARERLAAASPAPKMPESYSLASVILAWIAGFALGVLALLAAAILLGQLKY